MNQSAQNGHAAAPRHRVVIIGSGFGGLFAAKALRRDNVDVTLISRTQHHLFQPLLYQVATGILSEGLIAPPTRDVLGRNSNTRTLLGNVTDIDLTARTVTSSIVGRETVTEYDSLILAAGAGQSYFGNDHFAEFAPGMKTIDDALELRGRIFGAFELAELASTPAEIDRLMTFVVVGAGPTGVEMAGQIAELSQRTLKDEFRKIDPTRARILLVDGAPQVLPSFGQLGTKAQRQLESMGVDVETGVMVTDVDATGLTVKDADGTERRIESYTKVWAAGVQASPLGKMVADQSGAETDRAGRVLVNPDLTLPGHPEVYVVGDMISLNTYPGVAQNAIQGGRHAVKLIRARLDGTPSTEPYSYYDKGSMATISRFSAVASIGKMKFSGFFAWLMWLAVHLVFIIGFKNQITTLLHWAVSFLGNARSERTTTAQQVYARNIIERLGWDEAMPDLPRVPGDREGDQDAAPAPAKRTTDPAA